MYEWTKALLTSEELQDFCDDFDLQCKGPAYIAHMFPGPAKTPASKEYSIEVLRWAGWVYAQWIIAYKRPAAYVWEKADLNVMDKVWFEYHSIMNIDAVIYNLEFKLWEC